MSLFNRKTVLDGGIESYKVHAIDIGGFVSDTLGSITGANAAADAMKEGSEAAARATVESTDKNIDFQKWLWGEQRALLDPYSYAGVNALDEYNQLKDEPLDLTLDPGYQFRVSEGMKAYENSASAKGNTLSGAQAKALTRFGQGQGSQEYQNVFNRRQTNLDNLYRMISSGQNAAAGQANAGTAMGNQVSGSINTAGSALSNMYYDQGNIGASQSMSGFNTLMDIGNLAAQAKGAGVY